MAFLTKRKTHGGKYYIRWIQDGKPKWLCTNQKSKEKAEEFYDEWKINKGLFGNTYFTIQDLFDKRLQYVRQHCKHKTVLCYQNSFRHFLKVTGNKSLKRVLPEDLEEFKSVRLNSGACKTSINIDIRIIKATFQYACTSTMRMFRENPFKEIKQFSIDDHKKVYIPDHHIQLILDHTGNPLIKQIFIHALSTAMRLGEIINLRYRDINLQEKIMYISETKTGTNREIPVSDKLMDQLKKYFYDEEGNAVLYNPEDRIYKISGSAVSHRFKKITRRLELPESYKFHSFRHRAITNLLRNSKNVRIAQFIAGHSSIKTTQLYLHNIPDEVRAAVNTL